MTVKSIVSIEVDDSDFQRYAAEFAKYQEELKSSPGVWQQVAAASGSAASSAAEMGAAVGAAFFALHKVHSESGELERSAKAQASAWEGMARNAGRFASRVVEATRSLLRWGELTGLVSGILGLGGLFGIERLATSAGNQRRNALGLGVTPGEAKAFDVDYGRVVDPQQFLSGVNQALHDVTKRVGLYGAGLTEQDLKGKDTAQVSNELLQHLKKIADETPEAMMQNVLTARHLDQFINLQDFERLKNTPAGEIQQYGQNFQIDTKNLELTKQQTQIWQDLQVQLHRAGETISHDLIVRLTDLAPAIEHMSGSFVHLAEVVLNNPHVEEWIDDVAHAIDRFATYLNGPQVEGDVNTMLGYIETIFEKIGHVVEEIPQIVDAFADAVKAIKNFFEHPLDTIKEGGVNGPLEDDNPNSPGSPAFERQRHPERFNDDGTPKDRPSGEKEPWDASGWRSWMPWNWHMLPAAPSPTPEQKTRFDQLEGQQNIPAGTLNAVMQAESHGDPNATSPVGAKGQFQFMDATARTYDVQDPRDFTQSSAGAARYLHKLLQEFHGDLAKAAAGYNWGEDNVEKDIAAYGDKWREHLPKETERYVEKVTTWQQANPAPKFVPDGGKPSSVQVNVNNNTGGNAYISSSQIAPAF